ncbi:hypothetical protein B0T26DRAFT_724671 [Lasiosphaeria miniovina]|uniref:JmjC domain-containing protein n=1 Tax=Lasiosphaeria miniovina TaxID=1954250 RepID=A0AA40A6S5_9PEZI|nr:uncharacterized protein B0T26DRAFT_724671 [Lasiosphaeria miniovina]KAK0710349.1 hypothetical protein B0T26DRAFT_724671 [Lasiosphaeria miniovina]
MAEYDPKRQPEAVTHQLPLLAADGSTTPASLDVPATEYEIELLLTSYEASLVKKFRQDIRLCETDIEKLDKCIQKRDELLEENDKLVLRLAAFEHVMSIECVWYKGRKERIRQPVGLLKGTKENGAEKWDRFVGVAKVGLDTISKLLPPLKVISLQWGKDFVQHYQLASKGQFYCNKFSAAVKLYSRENAIRKLNQLLLRRFRMPGRRDIKAGVNPIEPVDLQNLVNWRGEGPFVKQNDPIGIQLLFADLTHDDLPTGFVFDQFGLLVRCPSDRWEEEAGSTDSGFDTAVEEIVDATPGEGETGGLFAAVNRNSEDAGLPDLPDDLAYNASSLLSTPLSSPPDSPSIETLSRASMPRRNDTASPNDGNANDDSQPISNSAAIARLRPRRKKPDYHENPQRIQKPTNYQLRSLPTTDLGKKRCCPPEMPPMLLVVLDRLDAHAVRRLLFTSTLPDVPFQAMCYAHLKKFVKAVISTEPSEWLLGAENDLYPTSPDKDPYPRRRRASLPDLADSPPLKRLRLDDQVPVRSCPSAPRQEQPLGYEPIRDVAYRRQALEELQSTGHEKGSWGKRTNELVFQILRKSKLLTDGEAYFLYGEEAARKVEFGLVSMPIFTQRQQRYQWVGSDRPVSQFFRRIEDLGLDRAVSVQVPSRTLRGDSYQRKTLSEVRDRFLAQRPTNNPWNLLDLQSPLPSALPSFLEGENCQLLLQVRDAILMGGSAERVVAPGQDWNTWRNVIDWALLSEGGHSTAPHMDSHGYSTWITAQEGCIGFGWMSHPSQQEEEAWMSNPYSCTDGEWRYVVLSPGQTVFFPSRTIHFVFRIRGAQTFALGGHILQWSGINQWLRVVIAQIRNPDITNEDIGSSASKYVHIIERLLMNRVRAGREEEVGGQDAIVRYSSLCKACLSVIPSAKDNLTMV